MIWSDWHAVQSNGTIPEDLLPANAFQLRYFLEWDYDIVSPATMFALMTGKWRWDIKDSAGGMLFEQTNQVRVMIVWLHLGGSVNMVSWNWDSSGDRIETTYPEEPETVSDMAESLYLDPASNPTADFTYAHGPDEVPTVYIQSYYYGPLYEIALPVGSVIAVPFHNVGATWLIKLANVGIRTARTGAGDAYTDRPGFNRLAIPSASSLLQRISGDEGDTWGVRRIAPVLSDPRLFKDQTNTLYCAGWRAKEYQVLVSDNDGRTWSNWRNMILWDSGYSDVDTAGLRDGTIISVARRAGSVWFRSSATDFAQTVRIGTVSNAMMLTADPQTQVLLVTDGQSRTYRSYDGGRSWATVDGAF